MEQNNFSIEIFGSVPLEETIYRACSKQRNDSVAEKKQIEDTVQQLFISLCPRSVHQHVALESEGRFVFDRPNRDGSDLGLPPVL